MTRNLQVIGYQNGGNLTIGTVLSTETYIFLPDQAEHPWLDFYVSAGAAPVLKSVHELRLLFWKTLRFAPFVLVLAAVF